VVVDGEREVLIVVDRERVAIVIIIKLATFDADALHTPCGSRTRSDRDNDQTHNI